MLEPQIAVPVADARVPNAGGKALTVGLERTELERPELVERRPVDELSDERFDLREVLLDVRAQTFRLPETGRRPRRAEEGGEAPRQPAQGLRVERAPGQPRRRAGLFRQPAHVHRPVDNATLTAGDHVAARALSNGLDAEIDIRRETAVEPHLLLAEAASCLQVAKVEETEVDRSLHLPHVLAGQKHPGRVRRPQRHRRRVFGAVGLASEQVANENPPRLISRPSSLPCCAGPRPRGGARSGAPARTSSHPGGSPCGSPHRERH